MEGMDWPREVPGGEGGEGQGRSHRGEGPGQERGDSRGREGAAWTEVLSHPGCSSLAFPEEGWPRARAGGPAAQQVRAEWPTERPLPSGQACELVVKDVVHPGHLARSGCSWMVVFPASGGWQAGPAVSGGSGQHAGTRMKT